MEALKALIKNKPVHERKIEIRTYPLEDQTLVVEGWLRDDRLVSGYTWDGLPRPEGVVHWMCVRLLVGGWPLTILDAEAEMPGFPHDLCPRTLGSVKRVIDLPIAAGYGETVRGRLGGTKSCAHLTHLIVTMGPAALHGYRAQHARKRHPVPRSLEEYPALTTLMNSCELWKEEGPLVKEIRQILNRKAKESTKPSDDERTS